MPSPDDSSMLSILKEVRAELRDHRTPLLQWWTPREGATDALTSRTDALAVWNIV